MSVVFFGFILTGFGPNFYFRRQFGGAPLPAYLHVHGLALTAWFAWLPLQSVLIRVGRPDLHRRLGIAGVTLGAIAILTGFAATLLMPARRIAAAGAAELTAATLQFWINVSLLISAATLLTLAVGLRRRPELHKRLIVATCFAMMPAPVAHVFGAGTPLVTATMIAIFLSLVAFDLGMDRRVRPVTWLIPLGAFGFSGLCVRLLAPSPLGQLIVARLAGLG
jgi:hypothetical protein